MKMNEDIYQTYSIHALFLKEKKEKYRPLKMKNFLIKKYYSEKIVLNIY